MLESNMSKGRILRSFEQNFMRHKLAMEFIEWDRVRSEIQSCYDAMKVTTNIMIDNGIKLSGCKVTANGTEFIR